jgi:glutaconate CoA-transferase subunit B
MGGAQIDQYGNLNSSYIGTPENPKVRLPGTGGGNDIASLARMIVAMRHEKRRFVEKVDFITSPGWIEGGDSRARRGLPAGGMWRVVTDLGVMGFHPETRRMEVIALHPGVEFDQVQENTGFELVRNGKIRRTEPPLDQELEILRTLDPDRYYTA